MISVPSKQTKRFTASQDDLFGNLSSSRNLDFNKKGVLSLAGKPFVMMTEAIDSDFETPIFIASDDDTFYFGTSGHFFTCSPGLMGLSFSEKASSPPTMGFQSDYAFFTADIHVSGTTTVHSLNSSTWTSRITSLSSSYPHPLCVSEHQSYLALGNGNSVRLYDSGYNLITTCTVPVSQIVTWIRWRGNLLYFGTRNITGGEGKMYIWNGSGTAANAAYGVGGTWAMSGCEYEDTIVVASSSGRLLRFAGSGFVPLRDNAGREMCFPVYYTDYSWGSSNSASNLLSKIASRGMVAKGSKIYMFVNAEIENSAGGVPNHLPNFPSGLWVFDPGVGLYHKAGVDHSRHNSVTVTTAAVTSDTLTLATAQIYETGDPVATGTFFAGVTGDLSGNKIYYAIKVDSTHIKLARTAKEAQAGTPISISGTPSGSDAMIFNVYKSVGATRVNRSGPVAIISDAVFTRYHAGDVVYGCETSNNTGTQVGCVMGLGMGKNVGCFITPKIQADALTDLYKKMIAKFPPLNHNARKFIFKYRLLDRFAVPGRQSEDSAPVTWVNSTSFTVNPKVYDVAGLQVGDEVEFTNGAASGYAAHVTIITVNSATSWTITIDEAMPDVAASDVSYFIFMNWIKYKTVSTTDDLKAAIKGIKKAALGKNAKWVQIKVEMRGYWDINDSMDFEELMLVNGPDQKYA